eukprot:855940-Prymnesium_polylepis.1
MARKPRPKQTRARATCCTPLPSGLTAPVPHGSAAHETMRCHVLMNCAAQAAAALSPFVSGTYPVPASAPLICGVIGACGGAFLPADKGLKVACGRVPDCHDARAARSANGRGRGSRDAAMIFTRATQCEVARGGARRREAVRARAAIGHSPSRRGPTGASSRASSARSGCNSPCATRTPHRTSSRWRLRSPNRCAHARRGGAQTQCFGRRARSLADLPCAHALARRCALRACRAGAASVPSHSVWSPAPRPCSRASCRLAPTRWWRLPRRPRRRRLDASLMLFLRSS